ncbi:MAG: GAF domain-containing protein, partial [Acidimicrobiales bacterium]
MRTHAGALRRRTMSAPPDFPASTTPPGNRSAVPGAESEDGGPARAGDEPESEAEEPSLFSWPSEPRGISRRQFDIEQLLAVQRSALSVVEPVTRLWRELATASDAAVTPRSLDTVLREALSTIGRLLSVNTVALLLANEDASELVVRFAIGLSEDLTVGIGIRAGEGMAGSVLASHQPLVVADLSKIHVVNPVLRNSGLQSIAAVPLLSAGQALGVFYAASYEADRFTTADTDLLQVVADRLAAALDRVRLFERERDARRDAQQLATRTMRMQQITAELARTHTAGEAAAVLIDAFDDNLSWWRAVWLCTDSGIELAGGAGDVPASWQDSERSPAAEAVRTGVPVFVAAQPAHAVIPVLLGDECVAALAVGFEGSHPFSMSEREDLAAIAGQASQAFDRARLVSAQRRATDRATFFARAAQLLAEAGDLADTLERLADLAVGALGEICLIDVVGEDGRIVRMAAKHRHAALQPTVDRLRREFAPDPLGGHPAVSAIDTGRATWAQHMSDDMLRETTVDDEHFALVKSLECRSYLTVPLVVGTR